jgi:hypothetical protein
MHVAHEIDDAVEGIVEEMAQSSGDEPDPWAEADAEAERMSLGNRPAPVPAQDSAAPEIPDPWAEADAEAAALGGAQGIPAGDDEEIIPLDWDFDPSTATGATEIQDEIDSLINADKNKDSEGGRG